MRWAKLLFSVAALLLVGQARSWAQESVPVSGKLGGQLFFRGGAAFLTGGGRGGEVFTDAAGFGGLTNDETVGFSAGFGLDIPLMKDPWFGNTILGEVLLDYGQFSRKRVWQTTSLLAGTPTLSDVTVNQLAIVGAPKYRIDMGQLRPWVIPVGMAFLVNSPPTNDTTYLDLGLHFGVGVDYLLTEDISIGIDWRYNLNFNFTNSSSGDFMTTGLYVGFNF
jgi:opacity protein-like surface antigen